jgi:hypothetical protein
MAFTKIAAAGIGSTGTITLQHVVVTGSVETPVITGAASTANVSANSLVVSGVSTLGSVVATTGTFSGNVSIAGTLTYEDVTNIDSVGLITARSGIRVNSGGLVVTSGVSTLGNTIVGGGTTQLIVNGDARITGILTVGTTSITFNGINDSITVGTAATINSSGFFGSGANLTAINASNLGSGTIPDARFPATLPAVSGANLTGIAAFAAGTLMLFQQTAAPTGWTKQTTHNDKSLRVVSGNASSGGTTAFTSVFASRTPGGSVSVSGSNSGGSIANTTATGSVSGSNSGGSVSGYTLSTSEIPSHTHSYFNNGSQYDNPYNVGGSRYQLYQAATTGATGGSGSHAHGFTNPSWSGSISINAHNHTFTNPTWSGSASFTGSSMDFAVQYVDLIIASKN